MVAKFETGHYLHRTLSYNENKVREGKATILMAENYPIDVDMLTFDQKLNRLKNQAALNENVTRNSVHISLNFDPSEQLEPQKLAAIATTYMDDIGFGEQPYLVYQHFDSGHPHIHIVSVKVDSHGKRIDTQNIGRNQSEKARKEIEIAFDLVKAEDSTRNEKYKLQPINVQKVQYGKGETKRAIGIVLKTVLDSYKYASLPELNALLKVYNVTADRGEQDTRMFNNKGLVYHVLDEKGNKIGTPIKASQFFIKPTLKKLEANFERNKPLKLPLKTRVKNAIDLAFLKNPKLSLDALTKTLEKEGIAIVLRKNDEGRIYGITYIDHKNKVVFNGSEIGKAYSSNAIQERCGIVLPGATFPKNQQEDGIANKQTGQDDTAPDHSGQPSTFDALTDALMQQEYIGDSTPYELRKKKKKKRKNLNNNQ
jgi:hypothetical protein